MGSGKTRSSKYHFDAQWKYPSIAHHCAKPVKQKCAMVGFALRAIAQLRTLAQWALHVIAHPLRTLGHVGVEDGTFDGQTVAPLRVCGWNTHVLHFSRERTNFHKPFFYYDCLLL